MKRYLLCVGRVLLLAVLLGVIGCYNPAARSPKSAALVDSVRESALPISGAPEDYDSLLAAIGASQFALLGEASHGTHEFYRARARISLRLITERDFAAVGIEGAWPAAHRVNDYVRAVGDDETPEAALSSFTEFPAWMWRNADVRDFARALRAYNDARPASAGVGFYGLDLYSLYKSLDEVIGYLDEVDPEAAQRARTRYGCFRHYADPEAYGRATAGDRAAACTREASEQLQEIQQLATPANLADPELFSALQNARVVRNAEEFYRAVYGGGASSWNIRDRHMAETMDALTAHLQARGQSGKIIVWAHNSHVGDARATEMGRQGDLNIGQLMRERHGADSFLLGFTTFTGTVRAASDWGGSGRRMNVRPALPESYEAVFHETGVPDFLLVLRNAGVADALRTARLERAIGVIYRPQTERASHYFEAHLSDQFDAVIHLDRTRAIEPLP